jgi:hypothetical protein
MALINWLLKLKMHANTLFLIFLYENTIWIFYIFERLDHMHENKNYFFFVFPYIFWNISEKTEYFNTRLVSLHYKNTNQY